MNKHDMVWCEVPYKGTLHSKNIALLKIIFLLTIVITLAVIIPLPCEAYNKDKIKWCTTKGTYGFVPLGFGTRSWYFASFTFSYKPIGVTSAIGEINYDLRRKTETLGRFKALVLPIYLYLDPLYWNKPLYFSSLTSMAWSGREKTRLFTVVLWQPYLYAGSSTWITYWNPSSQSSCSYCAPSDIKEYNHIFDAGIGMIVNPFLMLPVDLRAGYCSKSWREKAEVYVSANVSFGFLLGWGSQKRGGR